MKTIASKRSVGQMLHDIQKKATVAEKTGAQAVYRDKNDNVLGSQGLYGDLSAPSLWVSDGTKVCIVKDYPGKLIKKGNDDKMRFNVCFVTEKK